MFSLWSDREARFRLAPSGGKQRRIAVVGMTVFAALSLGCGTSSEQTVTVFAASSLANVFERLALEFEAANPGVDVAVSTGGSQTLRLQIEEGARTDFFISADLRQMEILQEAGMATEVEPYLENRLVIAVPSDNPAGVTTYQDLANAERIVLGTEDVPAGSYAREFLHAASEMEPGFAEAVLSRVVSLEHNVRLVLAKVELGEADAALVYDTDVVDRSDVAWVDLPASLSPTPRYYLGRIGATSESVVAEDWLAFLWSDAALEVLEGSGFRGAGRPRESGQ